LSGRISRIDSERGKLTFEIETQLWRGMASMALCASWMPWSVMPNAVPRRCGRNR
jgi:hypothetical protein